MRDIVIRHSREGGNPVRRAAFWIPAFAGMTGFYECIAQKVKNYTSRLLSADCYQQIVISRKSQPHKSGRAASTGEVF